VIQPKLLGGRFCEEISRAGTDRLLDQLGENLGLTRETGKHEFCFFGTLGELVHQLIDVLSHEPENRLHILDVSRMTLPHGFQGFQRCDHSFKKQNKKQANAREIVFVSAVSVE
jgi:hypothetical protein